MSVLVSMVVIMIMWKLIMLRLAVMKVIVMLVIMIMIMVMKMIVMLMIVIVVMLIYWFLHRHPPEAAISCRIIVLPGSDERRAQQRVQEAQVFQIPTGKNQQKSAQADVAQAYGSFQAKGSLPVFLPYTYFSIPFHELSRIFETHV
jgi:DNA integrity scanning protein DisA with diadenylate cyclase activity